MRSSRQARDDAVPSYDSGRGPRQPLTTYQSLVDEALKGDLPASDPISPTAAMRATDAVITPSDQHDWKLDSE
jgi:hypothetical protein